MEKLLNPQILAGDLKPGDRHYRAFVGPPDRYDLIAALQFGLMVMLGLRDYHTLLDIGCGSLRAGRLFIPYLQPERYYGVEPERWLVTEGIQNELGQDLIQIKKPSFLYVDDFSFTQFGVNFDFLMAQSIFSHAALSDIRLCLEKAKSCMEPHSIFAATFVEGKKDYQGSEWVYPGIVRYQPQTIKQLVQAMDLVCERTEFHHPTQTWYLISLSENHEQIKEYRDKINECMRAFSPPSSRKFILGRKLIDRGVRWIKRHL